MIEEFSFENYKSFKEMNTLNMTAAKLKSKYSRVDVDPTIQLGDDVTLLKSKAIYGANASGKSNIVKAFGSFIRIVQHSVKDEQILEKHMAPFFFQLKLSTNLCSCNSFFGAKEFVTAMVFKLTEREFIVSGSMQHPVKENSPILSEIMIP